MKRSKRKDSSLNMSSFWHNSGFWSNANNNGLGMISYKGSCVGRLVPSTVMLKGGEPLGATDTCL
jgi:hypothetical protein